MPHNFSKDRSLVEDKPVEKKKGLLEEFEEWLQQMIKNSTDYNYAKALEMGRMKLEELKEKYRTP